MGGGTLSQIVSSFTITTSIILYLCGSYMETTALAETESLTQKYNVSDLNPWWKDRLYSISTTAPVSTFMREEASMEMRESTQPLYTLIESLNSKFVTQRREQLNSSCNLPYYHPWAIASRDRPQVYQIGQLSSYCYSYLHFPDGPSRPSLASFNDQHFPHIIRAARFALANATRKIPFPSDGAWGPDGGAFDGARKLLETETRFCELEEASAVVRHSRVYLKAFVSDQDPLAKTADFARQSVFEFVNRDFSDSLRMIHRSYQPGVRLSDQNGAFQNSTTVLQLTSGMLTVTLTNSLLADPYSATKRALNEAVNDFNRGDDAITASNIAILALPMVMSIIPVAFVADLATAGTLIYVILTDVVSTLPILLKGVELTMLNQPKRTFTTVYFAGDERFAQIDIWSAKCHGNYRYGHAGAAFIATASLVMLLGIALEIWAIRIMRSRRVSGKPPAHALARFGAPGPFGRAGMQSSKFSLFGSGTAEEEQMFEFEQQNDVYKTLIATCRQEYEQRVCISAINDPAILQSYLDLCRRREEQMVLNSQQRFVTNTNLNLTELTCGDDLPSSPTRHSTMPRNRQHRAQTFEGNG